MGDVPNRGGGCEGAGLRADEILLTLRFTGATGRNSVSSYMLCEGGREVEILPGFPVALLIGRLRL